jgi:electron transfer flavoprotein alpha subunit
MAEGDTVLVYSEAWDSALELMSKGRELADKLEARLVTASLGKDAGGDVAAELIQHGADIVYTVTDPKLDEFIVEQYTDALAAVVAQAEPRFILMGHTKRGGELAPRLAARLRTGCAVGCAKVDLNDAGDLQVERVILGGNAVAVETYASDPQIATVAPKTYEPPESDTSRTGEIVAVDVEISDVGKTILKTEKGGIGECKLEDASVIVSGGRGFKAKEDLKLIEGLADCLNGEMGCSRPIAADLKWMSEDHWVGLSGHKVKPKVYIACGISGQIQHLAGMRDANLIIAVNKDRDAPIFNAVDYGLVGDVYKILPMLTELLKQG